MPNHRWRDHVSCRGLQIAIVNRRDSSFSCSCFIEPNRPNDINSGEYFGERERGTRVNGHCIPRDSPLYGNTFVPTRKNLCNILVHLCCRCFPPFTDVTPFDRGFFRESYHEERETRSRLCHRHGRVCPCRLRIQGIFQNNNLSLHFFFSGSLLSRGRAIALGYSGELRIIQFCL